MRVTDDDFPAMDDTALFAWRAQAREELQRLPRGSPEYLMLSGRYQLSTQEIDDRASSAWARDRYGEEI